MRFKILIAAALVAVPAAASAETPVVMTLERMEYIQSIAPAICREAVEGNEPAGEAVDLSARRAGLDGAEKLYLMNLCVLYAHGRYDEMLSGD